MRASASAWRIAIAIACIGCYQHQGRGAPALDAGSRDARASASTDTSSPAARDGSSIPSGPDVGPTETPCSEIVRRIRGGEDPASIGCGRGFSPADCRVPVGDCCTAEIGCTADPGDGGSHIVVTLLCLDVCDQGCAAQRREDCNFFPYCEFFDEGACGGAPPAIVGPICAPRRMGPCSIEGSCPAGLVCRAYQIHPCRDRPCGACGASASFCAP